MTQLRSVTYHRDHTVLPATRHKWTHPALTVARQAGTRFTCPGGMEGWVDLVDLIAPRPGVEPATFRSWVRRQTVAPLRYWNWHYVSYQWSESDYRYFWSAG